MSGQFLLVILDESAEFPVALRHACHLAKQNDDEVLVLCVVEQSGIEAWGGVERALDDEAFDRARKLVSVHEKSVETITGKPLKVVYRKGDLKREIVSFLETQPTIKCLILAAAMAEGGQNPLIQYLSSGKGLRKLTVPLTIVHEEMPITKG